ncbi:MAG TPA: serine/threonine-protein kinase, partial [Terriglobales bacterium]
MVGTTISHYRVLEKLGAGGMGVVYKAQDTRLGRFVALKFLPDDFADNLQTRERFQREARAASALNHPNISTIYDIGEFDGRAFIAMEFLDGMTLKDLVLSAPLELDRLVDIAVQVLDGLEAAHAESVIHRDIKPANIFVTTTGRVKILDFGLAKINVSSRTKVGAGGEYMTTGGGALGTMRYMSPEQALGRPMDARSDLFSFGITLYEMATGKMPFQGDTTGVLFLSIVQDAPMPPIQLNPDVPDELERIIEKCLEKDRDLRYQHASDIRSDLSRLGRDSHSSSSGVSAVVETPLTDVSPKTGIVPSQVIGPPQAPISEVATGAKRSHGKAWPSLIVLLAALTTVGVFYWRSHNRVALTDKDTVVLADFANSTGDAVFNEPLKTALMVDLSQSPFMNVLSDNKVATTLK